MFFLAHPLGNNTVGTCGGYGALKRELVSGAMGPGAFEPDRHHAGHAALPADTPGGFEGLRDAQGRNCGPLSTKTWIRCMTCLIKVMSGFGFRVSLFWRLGALCVKGLVARSVFPATTCTFERGAFIFRKDTRLLQVAVLTLCSLCALSA